MKDIDNFFESEYKFILDHRYYKPNRDYVADTNRFLKIIEVFESLESKEGKHYWLLGHAYYSLQRKEYRKGVIVNLEKYLQLGDYFEDDYKNNKIIIDFDHNIIKDPKTKNEMVLAKKIHLQMVYYLLAKTYQVENLIENAYIHILKGIEVYPENKILFFWELYEVLRKRNDLQEFLDRCENLSKIEKEKVSILIIRAKDLIDRGYVFKPRKK